jgi:transcriptional regulator with XRE-family HTH domain
MSDKKLNRIKEVLRSQGRTNKWLAEQLGKNQVTVSRWCNNNQQPDLETLYKIATLLQVKVYDLLVEAYPPQ